MVFRLTSHHGSNSASFVCSFANSKRPASLLAAAAVIASGLATVGHRARASLEATLVAPAKEGEVTEMHLCPVTGSCHGVRMQIKSKKRKKRLTGDSNPLKSPSKVNVDQVAGGMFLSKRELPAHSPMVVNATRGHHERKGSERDLLRGRRQKAVAKRDMMSESSWQQCLRNLYQCQALVRGLMLLLAACLVALQRWFWRDRNDALEVEAIDRGWKSANRRDRVVSANTVISIASGTKSASKANVAGCLLPAAKGDGEVTGTGIPVTKEAFHQKQNLAIPTPSRSMRLPLTSTGARIDKFSFDGTDHFSEIPKEVMEQWQKALSCGDEDAQQVTTATSKWQNVHFSKWCKASPLPHVRQC
eukprot:TRINITY_DN63892_c0_g1_i1.p1 TRINITY_DN63892_c0_g1~~TRINITY_DN63892_c0_g1_i1.p1  ORF type:complete len:360 (+),score=54.78 TRINITY_DN63892_c0_g1_i1:18-1097(+)